MNNNKEIISEIKRRYNIKDFFEDNGISLKFAGHNTYKGICPFHNDTDPSLTVNEDYQNYRCWACGARGDIINANSILNSLSFVESLYNLAKQKGIELEKQDPEELKRINMVNNVYKLTNDARNFYHQNFINLPENHPAKQMITKRNLSINDDTYGYALEHYSKLHEHLKSLGYDDETLKMSELFIYDNKGRVWDRFRGRLLFTFNDFLGKPISFSSRMIFDDDKVPGKYVNGKETVIFQKRNVLFNIHKAKNSIKKKQCIYVTEGPFDVQAFKHINIDNVVASSGTAFTEGHEKIFKRLIGEKGKIIFAFDGDNAGKHAAISVFENFPNIHAQSYIILFPDNKDPSDFIQNNEEEQLKKIIEKPVSIIDFVLKEKMNEHTIDSMSERYTVAQILIEECATKVINKTLNDYILRRISLLTGVSLLDIKKIYNTKKQNNNKTNLITQHEEEILSSEIEISDINDSDKCYLTALALLTRFPKMLFKHTSKEIDKKFLPFIKEFKNVYKKYKNENKKFIFIPEDYSMYNFCKKIQNIDFDENTLQDEDRIIKHYILLMKMGNSAHKTQQQYLKTISTIQAVDGVNNNTAIELLKDYK